ncbi:MAG: TonB-dependent receptor [Candidatus Neomarinimicrobiota bacterium]
MHKIHIFIVILLLWIASVAQNQISGKITDQEQRPLAGANVYLPELNIGVISDQNGDYFIDKLPNGKLKLRISYIGYNNVIQTVILNQSDIKLDVALHITPLESEEIVVSGGYNATQHENAIKIDILKLDEQTKQATPNFMEELTEIPGVDMISKGAGVSKPVIRGLAMNDVLTLNNGVRYENYQYSDHHPLGIEEFGVENVEVIKGPASLLYGSDAIGGVVNFIKEKPAPAGTLKADYHLDLFSNSLGIMQDFGIKGAGQNLFGGLRFGHKSHADYLQGGGDYVPNSRFNELSLQANGGYTSKAGLFKLFYDYNRQKLGLAEEDAVEEIAARGRENEIWYQQFNNHLLSSQNKLFLNRYKLDLNAAYQSSDLIHYAGENVKEIAMNLGTLTGETKLYLPSDEQSEYIVGLQGMDQLNRNFGNAGVILLPNARSTNYSAFVLLQHTFYDKLKLQAGARYDYKTISTESVGETEDADYRAALDKTYGSSSGSFGATYNLSKKLLLRANFAAAYRTPNLAELTSNGEHELRYEIGNALLIPQKAYETDLSLHYHLRNFTVDLAGFTNDIRHYIYITPTNDTTANGISIYRFKQSDAHLYGGETGIHYHPKNMEWLHLKSTYSTVIGKRENGDYLPFIPAGKWRCEVIAEKERIGILRNVFAKVVSTTAFMQNHPAPDEEATPGYTLINVSVGGNLRIGRQLLSVGVSINNLFDKKYIDHLSTLKEVGFYNPGRNLAFSLTVPFGSK